MNLQTLIELEGIIKKRGDKILIDTEECSRWRKEYSECKGCPSNLACGKLTALLELQKIKSFTHPFIFDILIRQILEAEEIRAYRSPFLGRIWAIRKPVPKRSIRGFFEKIQKIIFRKKER